MISFIKGKYSVKKSLFLRENVNNIYIFVKTTLKWYPLRLNSDASVSPTTTGTVHLDLIHDQDNVFVEEIDKVDRIYFGNIEINLREDISYSDLNDEDDEDCESDKKNTDSNTSNIGMECSELDLCESEKQKHFVNQTCNCEKLYNKDPCSKIVDNEVLIHFRL